MTSRDLTGLLPLRESRDLTDDSLSDVAYRLAFGAIGWPWLLYSLWGGTKASKAALLDRLDLAPDALPHLGSWKADTGLLHRIVDAVEERRPQTVVELGAGASSLVCGRALERNGGGRLFSYDQHAGFVEATAGWLADQGVDAQLRHAPLTRRIGDWPGRWYDLTGLPETIDLLVIDGPPWAVHPYVRGAAEMLFDRLSPGGIVLLDDAARPGERVVAARWKRRHPEMEFTRLPGGTKGTLMGRKRLKGEVIAFAPRRAPSPRMDALRRAAAIAALFGAGWVAHMMTQSVSEPAYAASFVDEASFSHAASMTRQAMVSQRESPALDRIEIERSTGIVLPALPANWQLSDVQLYPTDTGMAVTVMMRTDKGELVSLFAARAETPAEANPLLARSQGRAVAYWEEGRFAYALTADLEAARVLGLAADVAKLS